MRFARYVGPTGAPRLGLLDGEVLLPVPDVDDLLPVLRRPDGLAEAAAAARSEPRPDEPPLRYDDAVLLSPLACPPTVRDFYAFEQHAAAGRRARGLELDPDWYELPVFYFSNPYAVRGPGEVAMAPGTEAWDFELEVAAVIGTAGADVAAADAERHIAGYAILNDWSARDLQRREMRQSLGPAKGKDTATGLGPLFVTADELEPYRRDKGFDLAMEVTVNDAAYTSARWSDVHFSFAEMIEHASRGTAVRPGDVLGSGTCGTGCILELAGTHGADAFPWLQPGDRVVASVEQLGSQVATVVAPAAARRPDR